MKNIEKLPKITPLKTQILEYYVRKKSKFWLKIEILVKNRNFGQKSKFWSKFKNFVKINGYIMLMRLVSGLARSTSDTSWHWNVRIYFSPYRHILAISRRKNGQIRKKTQKMAEKDTAIKAGYIYCRLNSDLFLSSVHVAR